MEDCYIKVTFTDTPSAQQELLIAYLSEAGYEGFEQNENRLQAFIPGKNFDSKAVKELAARYDLPYSIEKIESRNWNKVWESNFRPVIIDDFVSIRADFHPHLSSVTHDIVITPKMSFGTGHHATTSMMIQQMKETAFRDKSVLDFGTGTGILAILAEKLGARHITAIDHDDWSIENAEENIQRNSCSHITIKKVSSAALNQHFDVILANINRNVILGNLSSLAKQMTTPGVLLISGILKEDVNEILTEGRKWGFQLIRKIEQDNWLCLRLSSG